MGALPQTLEPLWRPRRDQITNSNLTRFQRWLHDERGLDLNDHGSLYDWSVRDLEGFWGAIADFFGVRFHTPAERVLHRDEDPLRTRWFPGGTVNYAEHMLRFGQNEVPVSDDRLAVVYCAEPGEFDNQRVLTRKELIEQVTQLASAFSSFGVRCGDRVAGYLPNRIETLVAFLATPVWERFGPTVHRSFRARVRSNVSPRSSRKFYFPSSATATPVKRMIEQRRSPKLPQACRHFVR